MTPNPRASVRPLSRRAVALAAVVALTASVAMTVVAPPAGAAAGDISTVAGSAVAGYNGDGVTATSGQLFFPSGVTSDADGNMLVADYGNNRVRLVAKSVSNPGYRLGGCAGTCSWTFGDVYTIAGNGTGGYAGDGLSATTAEINTPQSVTADSLNNVLIADYGNARVRVVAVSAANPGYRLTGCSGTCTWAAGDIYTVAGNGNFGAYTGDGIAATTAPLDPTAVEVDSQNNLLIGDFVHSRIRVVAVSVSNPGYRLAGCTGSCTWTRGNIYTIAGVSGSVGYSGDGGPAASAHLTVRFGLAVDSQRNVLFADGDNRIRVVALSSGNPGYPLAGCSGPCTWTVGDIYTMAGDGTGGYTGDGVGAATTELNAPYGVTVDGDGNVVIADTGNALARVVAVSGSNPGYPLAGCGDSCTWTVGDIYTVAGDGTFDFSGDGGAATAAELNVPYGVSVDAHGNLDIADTYNSRIREVTIDPNAFLEVPAAIAPLGTTVTSGSDTAWTTQIDNASPVAAEGVTVTVEATANGTTPLTFDNAAINLAMGLPPATPTCAPGAGSTVVCSLADIPAYSSVAFTAFAQTTGLAMGDTITGSLTASAADAESTSATLSTVTVIACASGCTTGVVAPGDPISTPQTTSTGSTQQILTLPANTTGSSALAPVHVTLSSIDPDTAPVPSDRRLCPVAVGQTHCPGQISSIIGQFAKYSNKAKPIRVTIIARWGSSIPPGQLLMEKSAGGDPLFLLPCVVNPTTHQYNTPCRLHELVFGTAAAHNLTTVDNIYFTALDVHFARRTATGGTIIKPPAAPTSVTATPGSLQATVRWKAPTVTNGAGVTKYVVTVLSGGVVKKTVSFASPALAESVTGLVNGTAYTFKVAAANVAGTGVASALSGAVKVGAPGAPTAVKAVKGASGSLAVSFTAPASNGATISSYTATCTSTNSGVTKAKTGVASPLTVTGLSAGKTYHCTVKATNSRGAGPASSASAAVIA